MNTAGERAAILVVDDLPEKLLVVETVLAELGEELVFARSGSEALRLVLEREFAVILLDVNMPDIDGFETASLIRRYKRSAHTPIIFVTAYADEMQTERGYSLGAVDYILSPVVPEVLRSKVKVFVDLQRMRRQVQRRADEQLALAAAQAAQRAAEENRQRSELLSEASHRLSRELDEAAAQRAVLELMVPAYAQCARIALWDEAQGFGPAIGRHDAGGGESLAWSALPAERRAAGEQAISQQRAQVLALPLEVAVAVAPAGVVGMPPSVLPAMPSPGIATLPSPALGAASSPALGAASSPALGAAPSPGPAAAPTSDLVAVPLLAGGRPLGVLLLRGRAAWLDVATLEELGRRIALSFENARLYRSLEAEIAERRQAEQRLAQANQRKDEFLAMLAHELRNPLAPIRTAVAVIKRTAPPAPKLAWALEATERQVGHMTRLVEELLDVARISRGKITLRAETIDLLAVVAQAVETARSAIESRRHVLVQRLPTAPVMLTGDAVRLAQVLSNLLNNAAKYTEEGGRIELVVESSGGEARVAVRDNGVGIEPDLLPNVFELFEQGRRSLDRSQGGLGVGLTVVQRLVALHGGRVEAASEGAGRGAEFRIILPCLAEAPAVRPAAAPVVAGGVPRRVLVVDDNADAAAAIGMILELAGHRIEVVGDGPAALAAAERFLPEVVVLDIGLPLMDGYEVARRLRRMPQASAAFLVAVTGYGQRSDVDRALAAGIDEHLVKPADPDRLLQLIDRRSLPRQAPSGALPPAAQAPAPTAAPALGS